MNSNGKTECYYDLEKRRMGILRKFHLLIVFVLLIQLTVPFVANAAEDNEPPIWGPKINYLALGDSLAAGMNEQGGIGLGYSDFIAKALEDMGMLSFYTNDFAVPGYKTSNVLADITNNKTVTIEGKGEIALQTAIKEADFITLTMGANNLFQHIKKDATTGVYTIDSLALFKEIQRIGTSYATFFTELKKLNPKVQVFVMGYYNSFPYEAAELQPQLNTLVKMLNNTMASAVNTAGGVFVPTNDLIAANVATYLPNPKNVHLSQVGYEAVALEFLKKLDSDYHWNIVVPKIATTSNLTSITLSWTKAVDNAGVVGYKIYDNEKLLTTLESNEVEYVVNNIVPSYSYLFKISAVDAAGNESLVNPSISYKATGQNLFKDTVEHWAEHSIQYVVAKKMMKGYPDGTFKPNLPVTRVQVASILARMLHLTAKSTSPYSDTKGLSATTQADIAAIYEAGIIKNVNGKFNPNTPITRQQLAIMLGNAYRNLNGTAYSSTDLAPFSDIHKLDVPTKQAVTMLYDFEIVKGSNGKFNPSGITSRAQAAVIFTKFFQYIES